MNRNHVWRPLYVILGLVALLLLFRAFYVPDDFGVHGSSFMYNYYRLGSEQEWKDWPVKYRDNDVEYCAMCHEHEVEIRSEDLHGIIACQNCHGPALDHPESPEALSIDTSRDLCLRCHTALPYTTSERKRIPGIISSEHNPDDECVGCHDPHNPSLEEM